MPAGANQRDTVRYIGSNTPTSLNNSVRNFNLLENSNIVSLTSDGFNYYNDKAQLVKKTGFGTYKVLSKKPLRVQYTIKPGLKWSDGAPIDVYDMLLPWVASSGLFDDAKSGTLWDAVGKRGGTDKVTKFPVISDGGRTITFTYDEFVSSWEVQMGIGKPVHALTQLAFPNDSNQAAKVRFFKAVRAKDWKTLKPIADKWNTAWNFLSTTPVNSSTNPKLLVASGPYMVKSSVPGRSVTLVANPQYKSGPKPKIKNFQFIVINDQTAAAQALANGEADIMVPQATKEAVAALERQRNTKVLGGAVATYEHMDIVLNGPAWKGMSAAKAADLRRAFLLTVPRQEIVDKLYKPVSPAAKPLNSITPYFTADPNHAKMQGQNGIAPYLASETVRLAEARKLLAKHGYSSANPLELRMLWGPPTNERRAGAAELTVAAAAKAGIKLISNGATNWSSQLADAKHDVQFFAWVRTSTYNTANRDLYGWDTVTDKPRAANYFNWKNLAAEKALSRLFEDLTPAQIFEQSLVFEKEYFKDAIGLPMVQHPLAIAHRNGLKNIKPGPLGQWVLWNAWEWSW
jgi:peptide/nickel transport system substrate-binding protein